MNKKFYFALAATAALFASCSSDENFSDEARQAGVSESDLAKIELLLGNAGTRGTGTVGGIVGSTANKWGGQQFNVYMLNKGTLDIAKDADNNVIYENTVFTAPNELAGVDENTPAMQVTPSTDGSLVVESNVSYFPQDGNYDFWAYRLDGAQGSNVPAVDGDSMMVDFVIDGSQDIMIAKAKPNVAENNINPETGIGDGTYGTQNVPESRVFSAYSVRRGVKPMLKFEHQLARLTFKVTGSKELSNRAADAETSLKDTATTGRNEFAILVTDIILKSKNTGSLMVAHTKDYTPYSRIHWTGATGDLSLKQRGYSFTHADVRWISAYTDAGVKTFSCNCTETYSANSIVYPSQAVDERKGLPIAANGVEAGTLSNTELQGYYFPHIHTAPEPVALSVNANLDKLDPVAPVWTANGATQYATPVGEALLVAPQKSYELTLKTIQKVPDQVTTYYCTIEQVLGGNAAVYGWVAATASEYTAATNQQDLTATLGTDVNAADAIAANVGTVAKLWLVDTDGDTEMDDDEVSYKKVAVTTPASDPDYVYYFKNATDALAALDAYNDWVNVNLGNKSTAADNAYYIALLSALAKGTTVNGGAVEGEPITYKWVTDSKTIELKGPKQNLVNGPSYASYKANQSYTITLSLAGMERITGVDDNLGEPTYEVDTNGSEFDFDLDEQESL